MKRTISSAQSDADRQVDQEHPAPVVIVGQPAAEHRPEDRPDHHAAAEQRHRLAVLLARVDVEQGRLGERDDERAADALEGAEEHHLGQDLRDRAQHRGDGEARPPTDQQQALAPDPVGQPAGDRKRDRRGDDIAGQHPVDRVLRRAEARLHVRQRDVGDGRVEHLQQHRHHHPDGDDDAAGPVGSAWIGLLSRRRRHGRLLLLRLVEIDGRRSTDRPAIIGRRVSPSNAIRTGTRWVTLTQLPLAFCAGSTENSLPVPAPMLWTWPGELQAADRRRPRSWRAGRGPCGRGPSP